uniref:Uncharacterized protein n=1 Tax=Anopheles atroparvus TaxID=41427 RepID=A0A182JFH4_ANOAO
MLDNSGANLTSSSTVCSSAPTRRSPSASSLLRVAPSRSFSKRSRSRRNFSFAVRSLACASRSSNRSLCSSVTFRLPSSISSSVVFLICSIFRFDSSLSLSRSRSTSNSVWRRSRANVDVSCTSLCSSSRSFCQDSSRRVLVPGTFDFPLPMIFSSSSSLIFDCISDILISEALNSDTSSVRTLLASSRASLSSSSRQPICCSSVTILVLSSSSPLLLVTDARLRRFAFMSPICFWAASTSCLKVSRSRLNRSHCRCMAVSSLCSSTAAYRFSMPVSAAVSFFCASTNRRLMLVFSFTSRVSMASAWMSFCSILSVNFFVSAAGVVETLRLGPQHRSLLLDHLQLSLQVQHLLFAHRATTVTYFDLESDLPPFDFASAISACTRSNSRSFSISFLRSSLISSSITVIFFSSSGSFAPAPVALPAAADVVPFDRRYLLFALEAIFLSCITSESFSSSTRDDLRRKFSASSSAYLSCSRRSASRSSESCRSRSSCAGSSCEPPRVSDAREILLSADVDLPMLPSDGVFFVGVEGVEPVLSSSACSRRATSFETLSSSSSCLIFAARSPLAPSAAFSDSSCSMRRSDFFSLNESIRQFLVVWSSSFFSDAYSSACSSRKLSCISSISVSMLRSSRLISSFSSISSSQSVSAWSSFWRSCSSTLRLPRTCRSADISFSLEVRNFFSSCRSSISCFCSFTFCCSLSASEAAVLFDTVSIDASRRSRISLLSRSARSARAFVVSSSRRRLSISSCSSRLSMWSTMVASVVSVVSVVIDRSSSAFAFLSLIEMRNFTSSLLELGTGGSPFGAKDVFEGLDMDRVGLLEGAAVGRVDVSSVRLRRTMVFVVPASLAAETLLSFAAADRLEELAACDAPVAAVEGRVAALRMPGGVFEVVAKAGGEGLTLESVPEAALTPRRPAHLRVESERTQLIALGAWKHVRHGASFN